MFNIEKIREETDITGAGDWNDDDYVDAPTKGLLFTWKFLQNTATDATLAHLLTQMGSVLQVKDKRQGLIVDYAQLADWFYCEWYRAKNAPNIHGSNDTDNYIITITAPIWFGNPFNPHQGLDVRGLTSKVTSPASANNLDTDTLSVHQIICPKANFTEFIKHEKVDYTPTSGGWKKLPLYVTPLGRKIKYVIFYQTTGRDASATDTITIDQIEMWKDGSIGIGRFYADLLINLGIPSGFVSQTNLALTGVQHWLGNYMVFDFMRLNNGYPYVPSREGVKRKLEFNIYGGDANAVRMNEFSLLTPKRS